MLNPTNKMNKCLKNKEQRVCEDCNKTKYPIGQSMYDKKWRCPQCNRKFVRKLDKENEK